MKMPPHIPFPGEKYIDGAGDLYVAELVELQFITRELCDTLRRMAGWVAQACADGEGDPSRTFWSCDQVGGNVQLCAILRRA